MKYSKPTKQQKQTNKQKKVRPEACTKFLTEEADHPGLSGKEAYPSRGVIQANERDSILNNKVQDYWAEKWRLASNPYTQVPHTGSLIQRDEKKAKLKLKQINEKLKYT